jgi:hypothetical protein
LRLQILSCCQTNGNVKMQPDRESNGGPQAAGARDAFCARTLRSLRKGHNKALFFLEIEDLRISWNKIGGASFPPATDGSSVWNRGAGMPKSATSRLYGRSLVALAVLNFFLADARDGLGPFLDVAALAVAAFLAGRHAIAPPLDKGTGAGNDSAVASRPGGSSNS